jgi:hypothetical protein
LRPLNEIAPHIPETVSAVLHRAAAVFAKDRLATAAEMRQHLYPRTTNKEMVLSVVISEAIAQSDGPDVAAVFLDAEAVNSAPRELISLRGHNAGQQP